MLDPLSSAASLSRLAEGKRSADIGELLDRAVGETRRIGTTVSRRGNH